MSTHYIYKISFPNKKNYVGQTIEPRIRWQKHQSEAKKEIPSQTVQDAMKKYGIDNCKFEIIDFASNYYQANCLEEAWIIRLDSMINKNGYNITKGGDSSPKTEEWKAAMSSIKGGWIDKKHTPEMITHMSSIRVGIIHSEESNIKRSETMKEKSANGWIPNDIAEIGRGTRFQKGQVSCKKGKSISQETKNKISKSSKGRAAWNKITLSQDQINEIKLLVSNGISCRKISKLTGIGRKHINVHMNISA